MSNKAHKSKKAGLKFQRTDNKSVIIGTILATFIASTPYLFYLYESVPDEKVWNTFLFTYTSEYYQSAFVTAWTLTGKVIPLLLLFIWFFTNRHWWYHVLLIPIAMYCFQIFTILNDDVQYIDSNQILYLIPLMAIVIPSIYLIRAQIFNRLNTVNKSLEELEEEFKIKPKTLWGKIKQYF
ncbi:membrane protein [Mangrovimonas yunxiaonensis]|uniref:Membrane protein n=1 Tax=Mangrovimonas yunxiaonensis TaxID=1197477 RepID=A0A084THZ8_9FLAO|nr:hypothetical protein [Mangrovimonas yunxiaonensis]KFB00334.1 membrane protein [Mangrovimonas yunxiaonensis]GGH41776.1 hypothetical protein GCM10011364_12810 [Mangrovimonas yunxiaonensis]